MLIREFDSLYTYPNIRCCPSLVKGTRLGSECVQQEAVDRGFESHTPDQKKIQKEIDKSVSFWYDSNINGADGSA